MKRKFDLEDECSPNSAKQLKLIPFPNSDLDSDVPMSDVDPSDPRHTLTLSDASTCSSISSSSPISALYPTVDIYPFPFPLNGHPDSISNACPPSVRLLQPSSSFTHHGNGCSQIPKLRLACSAGVDGRRTMWSHCEQCGAISMVDDID